MTDTTILMACFSGITLLVLLSEKLFGGATKLTSAFHTLDKRTSDAITALDVKQTSEITKLRLEMLDKSEARDSQMRSGFESIVNNLHLHERAVLELRSNMAEHYMRRDSYYKANEELKRDFKEKYDELKNDMNEGFMLVRAQLDNVTKSIDDNRREMLQQLSITTTPKGKTA